MSVARSVPIAAKQARAISAGSSGQTSSVESSSYGSSHRVGEARDIPGDGLLFSGRFPAEADAIQWANVTRQLAGLALGNATRKR